MALPTDVTQDRDTAPVRGDQLRQEHNNLVAAIRIICAKLDADAGVTDTNYTALALDAAVATAPKKVQL